MTTNKISYQYRTKKETIIAMIKSLRKDLEVYEKLSEIGIEIDGLFTGLTSDFILDLMGFPIEESSNGFDEITGEPLNPNYFCRDGYTCIVMDPNALFRNKQCDAEETYEYLIEDLKLIKEVK